MDKITVVTVTYNCQKVVEKTILSVLSQDYKNIEYIVVDGCSNDKTLNIVEQYKDRIDLIVSEPDKGVYDAMNKSVKYATGDWILFMNAGDCFIARNTISKMFFETHDDVGVIFGDTISDYRGFETVIKYNPKSWRHKYMPSCHQSIFVKRELLLQNPFNLKYRIAADLYSFKCFSEQNVKYKYIPEIVARYDVSEGISQNPKLYYKELFSIMYNKPMSYIIYFLFLIRYMLGKLIRKLINYK